MPTDETGGQEFSLSEPETPSPAQALVRGLWKTVLWGTLILGALILLGIGMVYILRRKQKSEEDLLL
jgi:type II secretory pathway component PulF